MSDDAPLPPPELPARLRRAVALAYGQTGVVAVRIWQWPDRVAVGIAVGPSVVAADALRRVELAVAPLRAAGESWDFGLLDAT